MTEAPPPPATPAPVAVEEPVAHAEPEVVNTTRVEPATVELSSGEAQVVQETPTPKEIEKVNEELEEKNGEEQEKEMSVTDDMSCGSSLKPSSSFVEVDLEWRLAAVEEFLTPSENPKERRKFFTIDHVGIIVDSLQHSFQTGEKGQKLHSFCCRILKNLSFDRKLKENISTPQVLDSVAQFLQKQLELSETTIDCLIYLRNVSTVASCKEVFVFGSGEETSVASLGPVVSLVDRFAAEKAAQDAGCGILVNIADRPPLSDEKRSEYDRLVVDSGALTAIDKVLASDPAPLISRFCGMIKGAFEV